METGVRILFLGAAKDAMSAVRNRFNEREEINCETKAELEKLLVGGQTQGIHLVIVGTSFTSMTLFELAQAISMAFRDAPVIFTSDRPELFDRQKLAKNGFVEAFLLPQDKLEFDRALAGAELALEHRRYTKVRLVDIEPGTKPEFQISLFVPSKNQYFLFSHEGDELEPERVKQLQEHRQSHVYIPVHQVTNFYIYSAKRLLELGADPGGKIKRTPQNQAKLFDSLSELLQGLITDSYAKYINGKRGFDHTRHIVRHYIRLLNPPDWYMRVYDELGPKGDGYSHGGNVAIFSVLFSVALGHGLAHEMSAAGLIHDLGMTTLPAKLQFMSPSQMTPEELKQYRRHPVASIEILQKKKLSINETVLKAVFQHHEKYDGSGFPEGLAGRRISAEGQILALADRFDYLTQMASNISPLSVDQAFKQIEREHVANPEFVNSLRLFFIREKSTSA